MSKNKYNTLLSNTLLISMGTFGSKILVFLMVRFYTDYLTPSDYSTADLITQTANLLFPIISVGIADGVFRFVMDSESDKRSVLTLGFWCITAGALAFAGIVPLLNLFEDFKGYVWLIVVYTLAYCYHSLCTFYLRGIGKTALFAIQGIINTSLVIILNILFLAVFDMGITGYVLSVVLADTLSTLFLVVKEKMWRDFTLHPKNGILKPMLKYSIPLIPTTIFWWITSVSNRYMVNGFIGSDANGLYAVAYKLPTILTLISTMFMQAWQYSAVAEDEGDKEEHAKFFGTVWRSFQAVMFLSASGVIAFTKIAMNLLTADTFYSSWQYVPLLCIAMVFTSFASFMGTVYILNKKSIMSFLTALIAAGSNIILNLLLIPTIGVQGATIATICSYALAFTARCISVKRYIPFKLYGLQIVVNTVILVIQAIVLILEMPYWILIEAVCLIALLAINAKFLLGFVNKILSSLKRKGA
ncbi:MAG: polysaccharide biosynthesis C-terminal domain-containing protein [Clostridia bacterium]|nr:polysaccharide biosynthesis C-terminal domain-containing protein [Clostridia bacterium]